MEEEKIGEQMIETIWYMNFDWSMIWVCLGAIITLSLFIAINPNKSIEKSNSIGNYFTNTWKNHLYNLFAGFVTLSFISEVGFPIINFFIDMPLDIAEGALHFLAFLSGVGGGYVIAKIIRMFQKLN